MANLTEYGNYSMIYREYYCSPGLRKAMKISILIFTIPISIMAFFGNALIILALRKLSSLHSPSKILISCLACTDLGVGLISNPLLNGYYLSPENSKSCHYFWVLSYTATTILCGASLSTTTAISVDRLLALLLGLRYRQVVTVRRVMALVVTMWLSSILIAAVVYYSYLIALGMASAGLVLCIVISTFCYTKIYHTLRLSRAQVQDQGNQGQRNGEGSQLNKARYKKTVSTAVWIQMTLLACYLPFGLVGAVKAIFRLYVPSQSLIYAVTLSLLMSNSTINPLLYCWKIRDIRQAVRGTIRQFRCIFSEEA